MKNNTRKSSARTNARASQATAKNRTNARKSSQSTNCR